MNKQDNSTSKQGQNTESNKSNASYAGINHASVLQISLKKRRKRTFNLIFLLMGAATLLAGLIYSLNDNLLYYQTPSQVKTKSDLLDGNKFRLGGLVEANSVQRDKSGVIFKVTDGDNLLTVKFSGVIPDLFREGQGVVAEGNIRKDGIFYATTLFAKHDENYQPPGTKTN